MCARAHADTGDPKQDAVTLLSSLPRTCQASLMMAVALGPGGSSSLGHAAGQLVRHCAHIKAAGTLIRAPQCHTGVHGIVGDQRLGHIKAAICIVARLQSVLWQGCNLYCGKEGSPYGGFVADSLDLV